MGLTAQAQSFGPPTPKFSDPSATSVKPKKAKKTVEKQIKDINAIMGLIQDENNTPQDSVVVKDFQKKNSLKIQKMNGMLNKYQFAKEEVKNNNYNPEKYSNIQKDISKSADTLMNQLDKIYHQVKATNPVTPAQPAQNVQDSLMNEILNPKRQR